MASLIITGRPIAIFEFDHLPSWNDAIQAARGRGGHWTGSTHTKKWRKVGYDAALEFMRRIKLGRSTLIRKRAMIVVKVIRATERTYDPHNTYAKAIFDGFSDANIFTDDSWPYVPWVLYGWVHVNDDEGLNFGENKFVIEVYELDDVTFNGQGYILPDWSMVRRKE